jgi:hypothetical protein
MSSTLVIILSETRASELTFDNFKKNVIDELNADLCVCIGVKRDYDYENPYYKLAKFRFLYDEPEDYGDAFNYAYDIISKDLPKYERINDINPFSRKIKSPKVSNDNISYLGDGNIIITDVNYNMVSVCNLNFPKKDWANQTYGSNVTDNIIYTPEKGITLYKKPIHWREFIKIKDQWLGGVKDNNNKHPGSAGILIFFRWFLLKNLVDNNIIDRYDRFIITRSDFIYELPHPKMDILDKNKIWIPDGEGYGGYTDRHVVLSKTNIIPYLDILNSLVTKSNEYFIKMADLNPSNFNRTGHYWNLELLIAFHLKENKVDEFVSMLPYIMYSVRNDNGSTRWQKGNFSKEHGYFIKYRNEYKDATNNKKLFAESGKSISDFYLSLKYLV